MALMSALKPSLSPKSRKYELESCAIKLKSLNPCALKSSISLRIDSMLLDWSLPLKLGIEQKEQD